MVFVSAFSHFFSDFFSSFFKPMAPYFMAQYNLDGSTYGSILALITSVASLFQIFFGFLFDRTRNDGKIIFLILLLEILILSVLLFAPNVAFLFFFIFLTVLLNSAYHPIGAGLAGLARVSKHIAIFSIFGTLGSAIGPFFVTSFSSSFGFSSLLWVNLCALLPLFLVLPKMFSSKKEITTKKTIPSFSVVKLLIPCFVAVILRSIVMDLFHIYVPIFLTAQTSSLVFGGGVMTLGMLVGILSNYIGSRWILKIGIFRVNMIGFFGLGVFGLLFVLLPGALSKTLCFVGFDASGFLTMSANIVEAQTRVPNNRAFASSLTMGFAWSIGGFIGAGISAILGNQIIFLLTLLSYFALVVSAVYFLYYFKKIRKISDPAT